jgi:hypothetical protein
MRWIRAVVLALPSLVLASVGLTHPLVLTPATAHHWWSMHVWLVPVFPLLAVALCVLLHGERGPLAAAARVAAYGYATFYTALDVLAGIGAGLVMDTEHRDGPTVQRLFRIGGELGLVGSICFLLAAVLTVVLAWPRARWWALPAAALLVGGGWLFLGNHIYRPLGVAGQLVIALGLVTLALAGHRRRRPAQVV